MCVGLVVLFDDIATLARRAAMERAGAGREPKPTLIRHLYDLHMMRTLVDPAAVADLRVAHCGNRRSAVRPSVSGLCRGT